jgi:hypothetical protein
MLAASETLKEGLLLNSLGQLHDEKENRLPGDHAAVGRKVVKAKSHVVAYAFILGVFDARVV